MCLPLWVFIFCGPGSGWGWGWSATLQCRTFPARLDLISLLLQIFIWGYQELARDFNISRSSRPVNTFMYAKKVPRVVANTSPGLILMLLPCPSLESILPFNKSSSVLKIQFLHVKISTHNLNPSAETGMPCFQGFSHKGPCSCFTCIVHHRFLNRTQRAANDFRIL